MKIVINTAYGGFDLIDTHFEEYLDRKGIVYSKNHLNYYYDENEEYIAPYSIERDDPILVEIVEEFQCQDLKVVEIPDDVEYTIENYDGKEHIAEKHRTWS